MDTIVAIFKEKKLKLTPQRLAVYKYLMSTKEHPSAEAIYKALQPDYPTMSLATVYKTLKTLVEVNLIQEINVGEGNFRYDGTIEPHAHIQCINCGKVEDIDNFDSNYLNIEAQKHTTFNIISNQIYFYGLCENCQK
ncbi:MAG: transcriptional repressor [Clostridium sp.]|nr:transcriptional repressor [Clostridium sp.]